MADTTWNDNQNRAQVFAEEAKAIADGYAQQLAASIGEDFYETITAGLEWDTANDANLAQPDEPGVDNLTDLSIPDFDTSLLTDWDPAEYVLQFNYDSEFLESLEQNCRSILLGNIPGFSETSAVALFGYREERDNRDLALQMEQATVQFAARRGFPIPPDTLTYRQQELLRRHADMQTDYNREKTALLAERLTDMVKHAMSTGVNIEQLRATVLTKLADLYLDRVRALIAAYDANMRALVAKFESRIAELRLHVENNRANADRYVSWLSLVERNWEALKQLKVQVTSVQMGQAQNEVQSRIASMEKVIEYHSRLITAAVNAAQSFDLRNTENTAT